MYLNLYVPSTAAGPGRGRLHQVSPRPAGSLHRGRSRPLPAVRARRPTLLRSARRTPDLLQERPAQGRRRQRAIWPASRPPVFRTERRRRPDTGQPYPWIVRSTAMVNHFYVLLRRRRLRSLFPQVLQLLLTTPSCASTGTSTPSDSWSTRASPTRPTGVCSTSRPSATTAESVRTCLSNSSTLSAWTANATRASAMGTLASRRCCRPWSCSG